MENPTIFTERNRNPSSVKLFCKEFEKLKKKAVFFTIPQVQKMLYDEALGCLENAIEEQAKLQDTFEEGSKHYKLCFQKILFLEETGRHDIACEYSQELVSEIDEYSNIIMDAADFYITAGEPEKGMDYHEMWANASSEE